MDVLYCKEFLKISLQNYTHLLALARTATSLPRKFLDYG